MNSSDTNFFDLMENSYIKGFIYTVASTSFIISNVIVFYIISSFFIFSEYPYLSSWLIEVIFFFAGLVICTTLAKTNFLIRTKKIKKENKEKEIKELKESRKKVHLGVRNFILILFRLFYFNILNDLFIVLVIWASIFGLASIFRIIIIIPNTFTDFVSLLAIIGVLAGIFQFYIQNYKEKVTQRTIKSMNKYLIRFYQEVTFREFLDYLKKKDNPFYNTIQSKMKDNPLKPLYSLFKDQRSGRSSTNITVNLSAQNDLMLVQALEFSDINKDALKSKYEEFFKEKNEEIRKEIESKDISDLQKNILPNIIFYDEVFTEITGSSYEIEKKEDLETFEDFLMDSLLENFTFLVYKILGVTKDD
jgi:hypothetical protein